MLKMMQFGCVAGLSLAVLCLPGCGGAGARVSVEQRAGTMGQELQDAEKAYQEGAITKKEYEKIRKRIVEGK